MKLRAVVGHKGAQEISLICNGGKAARGQSARTMLRRVHVEGVWLGFGKYVVGLTWRRRSNRTAAVADTTD